MGLIRRLFNSDGRCRHLCPVCWPADWKHAHHQKPPDEKFEDMTRAINRELSQIDREFRGLETSRTGERRGGVGG